jgi:hypothetical protein
MSFARSKTTSRPRALGYALAAGTLGILVLAPLPADAHFTLNAPASWRTMDKFGSPQKLGPCGDESGGAATGTINAYRPGETISVIVDEKIFHPGHYRIALAVHDRSELPAEPPVTPASTPCGSVPIENPAVFPVLADGVLTHTAAFSGPQTVKVTLPANVTCTKCTLQVIEFMSDHPLNNPGGCFYHHCADIAIESDGGGAVAGQDAGVGIDGGGAGGDDGGAGSIDASDADGGHGANGSSGGASSSSGCSMISGAGTPTFAGIAGLFALASWIRRRRRDASSSEDSSAK